MNVFGISEKSIGFLVNLFSRDFTHEDNVSRYVEVEYKPNDWEWAKEQHKTEKLKKNK
tara:strand:+ start:294 stop:467 length:174 start_codon:yes stop_codon:yes gene_type:complete